MSGKATIDVTPDQIRAAVAAYDLLGEADVRAVTEAMQKATELGARSADAITETTRQAKGKPQANSVLASVAVTNFLVGFLAGRNRTEEPYCTFLDTGERRYPTFGEWYFSTKIPYPAPVLYGINIALRYEAGNYGILKLIRP